MHAERDVGAGPTLQACRPRYLSARAPLRHRDGAEAWALKPEGPTASSPESADLHRLPGRPCPRPRVISGTASAGCLLGAIQHHSRGHVQGDVPAAAVADWATTSAGRCDPSTQTVAVRYRVEGMPSVAREYGLPPDRPPRILFCRTPQGYCAADPLGGRQLPDSARVPPSSRRPASESGRDVEIKPIDCPACEDRGRPRP